MDEPEDWIRSTFCGGGACAEVLVCPTAVHVRNSQQPEVVASFTRGHWRDFVAGVKAGLFDRAGWWRGSGQAESRCTRQPANPQDQPTNGT